MVISIVILASLAVAVWFKEQSRHQPSSGRPQGTVTVVVAPVEQKQVRQQIEALGTVRSRESIILTTKVTEKVEQVHFADGQQVRAGQLLLTLESGEQQAKVRAAEANLREQQREYKRIEGLVRRNTIASSELDKLFTDIEVAKAILAQNQAERDARFIRAPFSGLLGFRQISTGALVTPGTVITTLDDIAKVKLDFSVPEVFIGQLKKGSLIEGQVAAFAGRSFNGEVTGIDSRIDPQTRSVVVRAEIDNPEQLLRPGMLITLQLIVVQRQGMVVPEEALVPRQKMNYLFVVNGDGVVEQRAVTLGIRRRGEVEIVTGVQAGEQVIIRGTQRARPGLTVETRTDERFTHLETKEPS
ncbi:efflux transporter periplasmic adaptor subunit [Photobacterium sanctipauli]|uniref:Efflux transporter periplasmic adaptor subunit n=1 Tax=Photobacterium sanctipauli TaxID=1342794 RepID=A0A2T3NPE3_9GAMM|nr:efflux transporter periplasmic adaptor subunit [Photobacterium sanctipauli]